MPPVTPSTTRGFSAVPSDRVASDAPIPPDALARPGWWPAASSLTTRRRPGRRPVGEPLLPGRPVAGLLDRPGHVPGTGGFRPDRNLVAPGVGLAGHRPPVGRLAR